MTGKGRSSRPINPPGGILGADTSTIIGKKLGELTLSEDTHINDEITSTLFNRGKGAWEGVSIGGAKSVKARILPLLDEDYSYLGALLTPEEASSSGSVTEYLTEAEKHQYMVELAAGVAHEVNNPLGINFDTSSFRN